MNWYSWLSQTSLDPSLVYEYGLAFACNELQKEDVVYFNHEFLQSMGISIAKHRLEILKLARKETGGRGARPHALNRLFVAMNKTKKCLTKCIKRLVFYYEYEDSDLSGGGPKSSPYQVQWRDTASRNHKSSGVVEYDNKHEDERFEKKRVCDEEQPSLDRKLMMLANKNPIGPTVVSGGPVMVKNKRLKIVSGPLDRRAQEKLIPSIKGPRVVSGPLDGKMQEQLMLTCRSPIGYGLGLQDGRMQEKFMLSRPKFLSGPLDRSMQERLMFRNRSPRASGPLDARASPNFSGVYSKENTMDCDNGLDSIWATLFHDMKPT